MLLVCRDLALPRLGNGGACPQGVGVHAEVGLVAQLSDPVVLLRILDPLQSHGELGPRRVNHEPGLADLKGNLLLLACKLNAAGLMLALRHVEAYPCLRYENRLLGGKLGQEVVIGVRVIEAVDGKILLGEETLVEL